MPDQTPAIDPQDPRRNLQPVHVLGPRKPLPVGRLFRPEELTAEERADLEKLGWDGKTPVPSNFAAHLPQNVSPQDYQQALAAATEQASEALPPQYKPGRGITEEQIKIKEEEELPSEVKAQMERINRKFGQEAQPQAQQARPQPQAAASDMFSQAYQSAQQEIKQQQSQDDTGIHPDVAKAARQIASGEYDPEAEAQAASQETQQQPYYRPQPQPEPEVKPQPTPAPEPAPAQQQQAPPTAPEEDPGPTTREERRQAQLKARIQASDLTNEEIDRYQECVVLNSTYTRSYTGLGGKLRVTYREAPQQDIDLIVRQESLDRFRGRVAVDPYAWDVNARQYTMIVSLVDLRVWSNQQNQWNVIYQLPAQQSLDHYLKQVQVPQPAVDQLISGTDEYDPQNDTRLRLWYLLMMRGRLNGATLSFVTKTYARFANSLGVLQDISLEPDFFENPESYR